MLRNVFKWATVGDVIYLEATFILNPKKLKEEIFKELKEANKLSTFKVIGGSSISSSLFLYDQHN